MSKIFQRRIDLNIPNLTKPLWKVMSVQNLTGRLYLINMVFQVYKVLEKPYLLNKL